jgi:hypothetical protein
MAWGCTDHRAAAAPVDAAHLSRAAGSGGLSLRQLAWLLVRAPFSRHAQHTTPDHLPCLTRKRYSGSSFTACWRPAVIPTSALTSLQTPIQAASPAPPRHTASRLAGRRGVAVPGPPARRQPGSPARQPHRRLGPPRRPPVPQGTLRYGTMPVRSTSQSWPTAGCGHDGRLQLARNPSGTSGTPATRGFTPLDPNSTTLCAVLLGLLMP